jgi:Zn finger protein HypA/HybF involved in hydrogenase expression
MGDFIKKLIDDISDHKKKYTNTLDFIKKHNLIEFKGMHLKDIPSKIFMGSAYLIKGSTILYSYSWCDYCHSPRIQINQKQPMWVNSIQILNMDKTETLYDSIYNTHGSNTEYNYYYGSVGKYIFVLLDKGFKLYY